VLLSMLLNQNPVLLSLSLDLELLALLYVTLIFCVCVCVFVSVFIGNGKITHALLFKPQFRLLKGQGCLVHQELLGLI